MFIAGAFNLLRRLCSRIDIIFKVQQILLSPILKDLEGRRVRTPSTNITGIKFRRTHELLEAIDGWYKFVVTSGPPAQSAVQNNSYKQLSSDRCGLLEEGQ